MDQDQNDLEEENTNLKSQIESLQTDNASAQEFLSKLHWSITGHLRCVQLLHGNGTEGEKTLLAALLLGLETEAAAIEERMPHLRKLRNTW